jgi:predicted nucleic acid-binding protein
VTVVVDADVVIGALDASDAHHADARERFEAWQAAGTARLMSAVNLSEVLIAPAGDARRLSAAREAIAALGLAIHAPTEAIAVDAARIRVEHPISLPDAYLLATARHAGASIASFDRKVLEAAARAGLASSR